MKNLVSLLALIAALPAHAQSDLGAVQDQLRGILRGAPAPAGVAVPKLTGAPVVAQASDERKDYKGADFTLKDLNGDSVSLSQFAGQYVLLDFSATWCGPCNQSIPRLQELHSAYDGKGLVVLAVYEEDARTVKEHMREHGARYKVLIDSNKAASSRYLVRSFPTFYLIGPDGSKLGVAMGRAGIETLLARFKAAGGGN